MGVAADPMSERYNMALHRVAEVFHYMLWRPWDLPLYAVLTTLEVTAWWLREGMCYRKTLGC